jgi:WD40 repeat protein/uncharacterized caspase-like protein
MKHSLLFALIVLGFSAVAQNPEISITTGHSGLIMKVALAPQGNLVATSGADHLIKLWDKNSGKEITTLNNKEPGIDNEQRVESFSFFDDGKRLMTVDENGMIKVWNIQSEKMIRSVQGGRSLPGLSADLSGNKIVYLNESYSPALLDLETGNIQTFENLKIRIVKFNPASPDEIFAVDLENNYIVYDLVKQERKTVFEQTDANLFKAAVSRDGKLTAVITSDMRLSVWNNETGKLIKKFDAIKPIEIDFHPVTGELIVLVQVQGLAGNMLHIYDSKKFILTRKIENLGSFSSFFALSKNGKYLAVNAMSIVQNSPAYSVDMIDWNTGTRITSLRSKAHKIWQVEAAGNTPYILALYSDLNLRIWNMESLQIEKVFPFITRMAVNPDGNLLAMQGYFKETPGFQSIAIYDLDSLKIKSFLPASDLSSDMKFCADNRHIITSTIQSQIHVWSIEKKEKIRSIEGSGYGNQKSDVSKDLRYIAYGASGIGGIGIYDTQTKQTVRIENAHPLLGVSDLKFSSDGKYLLSCSFDKETAAWETGTWKKIRSYEGHIGPVSSVNGNAGNDMLASSGMGSAVSESDYAVNVWKISESKPVCQLKGHQLHVNSVAFNDRYRLMISGSDDGTIKVWSLDSCKEIVTCIAIDYDDYMFVTPDYYYTGSKDAMKGVGFKMDGIRLYPFEQYDLRLNRPDIIAERLGVAPDNLIKAFQRAYLKRLEKMGFNQGMFNEDFVLPKLEVLDKEHIPFNSPSETLELDIEVSDVNYPLDRINVWINDVPVYGREGINLRSENTYKLFKTLKLQLSQGKNKIQISVLNSKGVESLKETIETIGPDLGTKPDLYLIAVGVSDYFNDAYDLNYAAKDAGDLSALFASKNEVFNEVHIIKILDHDAVKTTILNTQEVLKKSGINDLVVIYTAGHGFLDSKLDYYFATADVNIDNPASNGLSYEELESMLDNIPARKKLLLMDACHSGEIDFDEYDMYTENMSKNVVARGVIKSRTSETHIGLDNSFRLMKELFSDLRRGSGAVVIASAGGVEYAFESDELKNGVFTYVLINALKDLKADTNNDEAVSISELQEYVMKTVSELTRGFQNPTARRENLEFDFRVW